jgi:DNA repair photolyase
MNRKPVLYRENTRTVLTLDAKEFQDKQLCDGIVMNLGDACAYSCTYCYVPSAMLQVDYQVLEDYQTANQIPHKVALSDVVIRRRNVLPILKQQLIRADGSDAFPDPEDKRVVFTSSLVDIAANFELLRETAEACNLILEHTHWDIRLLSKSNLLHKLVADLLIPMKFHHRLIFGFSTGTLDDKISRAIERGTPPVSARLESLQWLQRKGLRTFGMICPSLPQKNYDTFARDICSAINVAKCEHVWAEVVNSRRESIAKTVQALDGKGLHEEAQRLANVQASLAARDEYAQNTYIAHATYVHPRKLRFLQYVDKESIDWWQKERGRGAVLLGEFAEKAGLVGYDPSAPQRPGLFFHGGEMVSVNHGDDLSSTVRSSVEFDARIIADGEAGFGPQDRAYLETREKVITRAVTASIAAAQALYEIYSYRDGLLWKPKYKTFEAYCSAKWAYAKAHAYRLVNSGDFLVELQKHSPNRGLPEEHQSPNGDWYPRNEAQIRPVLSLPRDRRIEFWGELVKEAKPSKLTSVTIAQRTRAYATKNGFQNCKAATPPPPGKQAAERALDRLCSSIVGLPEAPSIEPLIEQIRQLLQ